MRILHLIDQATVRRQPARAALLADLVRHDRTCAHEVWFIGGNPTVSGLDLPAARCMYPWLGLDLLEPVRLWANRHVARQFDVVHPWSPALAHAVRWAGWRCPVGTLESEGIGVSAARRAADRAAVRAAWGIDEDRFLVGAIDDRPAAVDAMRALRIVGLVGEAGHPVSLVVGPQAAGRDAARRIAEQLGRPDYLLIREDGGLPWRLATGCDAVMLSEGPADAPLSVAWAASVGRPILAPRTAGTVESLAEEPDAPRPESAPLDATGWNAVSATDRLPVRALATRLRQLVTNPEAHRMAGETISRWGRARFDLDAWCQRQVARYRTARDGQAARADSRANHAMEAVA